VSFPTAVQSPLVDQLSAALGPGYAIERELGGGGMSRVFVALDLALERRVAVKVLPEYLAASVSVDRFKREILLSAGLQHPHIVGVLSAGDAAGLPFFVMPYVEGQSLGVRLARDGRLSVRDTVSILKDVARALAYAHERGVVHRDVKPHNVLLSAGAATVTDFGVAKALRTARRAGDGEGLFLTEAGTSLGTPMYMAPEQAAADPEVDHRADIYALGVTAYEMLTGSPPFAGLPPRALLAARMTEDPPRLETQRADVPAPLARLVGRCLARDPADRPQSAAELLAALDDPAVVSGAFAVPERRSGRRPLRDWWAPAAAVALLAGAVGALIVLRRPSVMVSAAAPNQAAAVIQAPAASSIVVLPLVSIGTDSSNAYLAAGITNELASALSKVPGVHVVSPSRAAAMLASGRSPDDVGEALHVAQQVEGTVQREGRRLRVTARLVGVNDGVMRWSDVYERDSTDLLTVQQELARVITGAVGEVIGTVVADARPAAASPTPDTDAAAYDLYQRGRFQLGKRSAASLRQAISYFQRAIDRDPTLARAYSGLASAQGLLPLYANVPPGPSLAAALRNADRAIALDGSLAEPWASRGALRAQSWRWSDAERDFRRAIAIDPSSASAYAGLGELLLVTGRIAEATESLQRAAQIEPASPVVVGSLAMALSLSGRGAEAVATAERAVSYDSTLFVTRFMLGATRLYAWQPAAAIAPLEAAVRIDPESFTALGMLGFAYATAGDLDAARRTRARVEAMRAGTGAQVALARIALGLGDTAEALTRLERAARARDPFFATEPAASPVFASISRTARYDAILKMVGLREPRSMRPVAGDSPARGTLLPA
jgi:serine/threonine-protein kinase